MQTILKQLIAWAITIFFGACFLYLLGIRTGFLQKQDELHISDIKKLSMSPQNEWMNIFQNGNKIGYSKKGIKSYDNGYELSLFTYMKINTMGVVQDMHIDTKAFLNKDYSLMTFVFNLKSELFQFSSKGKVKGNLMIITIYDKDIKIPYEKPLYLSENISKIAWSQNLKNQQSKVFHVFDPATMGKIPVIVTMKGYEFLDVMGKNQKTMKLLIDLKGTTQTAWLDMNGIVVQEKGFMGFTLKKTDKAGALNDLNLKSSQELTSLASIKSNIILDHIDKIGVIKYKISGINNFLLKSPRQDYNDHILTIQKEIISENNANIAKARYFDYTINTFLKPTPLIQSDHPVIINKISEIINEKDTEIQKVIKIKNWLYKNISKKPVISVPNALETLKNKMGDCNEHAALMAAMARAAGIPAQIEAGLVYLKGRFYYHAWNSIYINEWITVDSLMGQMPADVTHISLVRGNTESQIDIVKAVGNIKLEILSYK